MKSPATSENPWIEFWNSENIFTPEQWAKNAQMFLRATEEVMDYKPTDVVLDIGCGTGSLAMCLKSRVSEICGLDTSSKYIDEGRQRFKDCPNIHFFKIGDNYLDFSFLQGKKFDKIICHSVVQYYRHAGEIKKLIQEMKKVANPGARFLISDIPMKDNRFSFLASYLKRSYQSRFLWEVLKFTWRAWRSDYYKAFRSQGLLQVHRESLLDIANSLGVKGRLMDLALSLSGHRCHLLLEF